MAKNYTNHRYISRNGRSSILLELDRSLRNTRHDNDRQRKPIRRTTLSGVYANNGMPEKPDNGLSSCLQWKRGKMAQIVKSRYHVPWSKKRLGYGSTDHPTGITSLLQRGYQGIGGRNVVWRNTANSG